MSNAILQASVAANSELYEEIKRSSDMMNEAVKKLMRDEIAEAVEEEKLIDIRELMKNMKWTAEQAMKALGISESDQHRYSAML